LELGVYWLVSKTKFNKGRKAVYEREELSNEEVQLLDLLAQGLSRD
jgi:hypothetical protein